MAADMEFCLLGPIMVHSGETALALPRGKQRAVLAALLLAANQAVGVDELAETLWGPVPPPSRRPRPLRFGPDGGRRGVEERAGDPEHGRERREFPQPRFAAGLVTRSRAGRAVLYQWTETGARLTGPGS